MDLLKKIFKAPNYYVVVFDVCSSSVILEKLQELDKLKIWRKFWNKTFRYLNNIAGERGKCTVYKFVGDGFILLYYTLNKKTLLDFCDKVIKFMNDKLSAIVTEYNIQTKRLGITIGIDKGILIPMRFYGSKEYTGKAINIASRLQSLLKKPEDTNTILVSPQVYQDITPQLKEGNRSVTETRQVLHNLFNDEEFLCYRINPKR